MQRLLFARLRGGIDGGILRRKGAQCWQQIRNKGAVESAAASLQDDWFEKCSSQASWTGKKKLKHYRDRTKEKKRKIAWKMMQGVKIDEVPVRGCEVLLARWLNTIARFRFEGL